MWLDEKVAMVAKLQELDALLLAMEIEQGIEVDNEKIFQYNKEADKDT